VFPIDVKVVKFHKCRGRFGSRTHIGSEVIEVIVGSKEGYHGSIKKPKLPQNQGLELEIISLSCEESNYKKNPS